MPEQAVTRTIDYGRANRAENESAGLNDLQLSHLRLTTTINLLTGDLRQMLCLNGGVLLHIPIDERVVTQGLLVVHIGQNEVEATSDFVGKNLYYFSLITGISVHGPEYGWISARPIIT